MTNSERRLRRLYHTLLWGGGLLLLCGIIVFLTGNSWGIPICIFGSLVALSASAYKPS